MEKFDIEYFNQNLDKLSKEDRRFLLFKYLLEYPEEYQKLKKGLNNSKGLKNINTMSRKIRNAKSCEVAVMNNIEYCFRREDYYKRILEKAKQLAKELNLTNSLEIANLFTYLLWNGYFSKNKSLVYRKEGRYQIAGEASHDIMSGGGVCLNFSDMLTDFMNKFDYSSASLLCYVDSKKIKKVYTAPINKKFGESSFSFEFAFFAAQKIFGNHAFNLIKEKNKLYIYDCTNFNMFKIHNKNSCSIINGNGSIDLKPYISYTCNIPEKAINTLDLLHMSDSFEAGYDIYDFIYNFENSVNICNENIHLLDDFHDEIKNDIDYIDRTNKQIKKYFKEIR